MEQLGVRSATADLTAVLDAVLQPRTTPPGFAPRPAERARPVALPAWFIDRCRRAYLSVTFQDGASRVLGITSAHSGEGKTSVAIAMAMAIAVDTLEPTLLLECDLEHPSFARYFGLAPAPGLCEWLQGLAALRIIRAGPLSSEFLVPAGLRPSDPARLVYQLSESGLMEELRPRFRNVILDLPPMINTAYSSLASKLAVHILLVVRHGVTPIADVEKAVFVLGQERLKGIVLNGCTSKVPGWLRQLQ